MHEMWEMTHAGQGHAPDRRYVIPEAQHSPSPMRRGHNASGAADDLHAWSIYRQNLNSDFTDSALGSDERSPLPYGNFQLREQTVQSILRHPRLAPRSELGSNMYAYLKFGLPRVLPPSMTTPTTRTHLKDASSGYDSADERNQSPANVQQRSRSRLTDRGHGGGGGQQMGNRARSETDLREGMIHNRFTNNGNANHHSSASHLHAGTGGNRSKMGMMRGANSESNLLSGGHPEASIGRAAMSKAGSQASLVSRQSRPHKATGNGFYNLADTTLAMDSEDNYFKHPHLQVRGLSYEVGKRKSGGRGGRGRLLDSISFDIRGGEIMALMTTTPVEGTTLLDILAGRRTHRGRLSGEFVLNGNPVTLTRLGCRVAYVRKDYRMHPDITVAQTMKFHSLLRKPIRSTAAHDRDTWANILLEELGLGALRHSLVENLAPAERQRLAVGCQLLLDTDILLLDQPTRGMDIFDTFFLVDYLRQWCSRGRVILMTIHPPTFEIFSMFTKVALTSMGRLMFYGHRREMLPYFAFIEYPCPGFKNPSDYYLDLVTLDDLSAEALLESSQRIEALADAYRRKQEPLADPGPPSPLPPKIKDAGALMQIMALWMYTVVFTFPWNVVRWLLYIMFSAGLSVVVGAIFWNVRLGDFQDQNSVDDRLGQHWTLMCVTSWPVILALVYRDVINLKYVTRDNEERLYSKGAYMLAKTIIEVPFIVSVFLAYVIPAYVMAGISLDGAELTNFYRFIGYMLLYLYALRMCHLAFTYLLKNVMVGTTFASMAALAMTLSAGYLVHVNDLGEWCSWAKFGSPTAWLLYPIIRDEFKDSNNFICPRNPEIAQGPVMVKADCGIKDGASALHYWNLPHIPPMWVSPVATAGIVIVAFITTFIGFILRRHAPAIPPPEKP